MNTNLDERLLGHWMESQQRQGRAQARLANSSLPVGRFEGWALDLIADALSAPAANARAEASVAVHPVLLRNGRPAST